MLPRPSIFVFYGDDHPLLYQRIEEEKKVLLEKYPSLVVRNFEEIGFSELLDLALTESLFDAPLCLKVRKIRDKHSLSDWEEVPHFLFIISDDNDPYPKLSLPFLKKIPCSLPKPWDIIKILQRRMANRISAEGIEYLSYNISSILELDELEKQCDFYGLNKLTLEDISSLLPDEKTKDFLLTEYFFNPEKGILFFHIIERIFLQTSSLEGFWALLFRKTQIFLRIHKGLQDKLNRETLAKDLKIHPFILDKNIALAQSYSTKSLQKLAHKIVEAHYWSRYYGSKMDRMILTQLFISHRS